MPKIYLDPSVDDTIQYVGGGNEEYYMNPLNQIIEQSNAGDYNLHLSLRSTPAPAVQQGPIIYYNAASPDSQMAAYDIARSFWAIYPNSNLVNMVPNSTLSQITLAKAPTVLVDMVNPANYADVEWLKNNIYAIARAIVFGLTDYFEIPFNVKREPLPVKTQAIPRPKY